ncbi:hypothetical protein LAV_00190 [Sphingobium phage Lacusarx]|uniref:Uncharacterized protein n=1 Tax=Sphingobium phage Lacusarx TaxID=1980139 RepID=A0A1W6DXD8_9CAUD|nr:hypothetical protein FDH44_gp113 [Sphingobium phage Lacusarx]ARK07565.1 hypothetical protein LAV_00190 [Sphingobium phage Lacusarx]
MTKFLTPEEVAALPPETALVVDIETSHDHTVWIEREQVEQQMGDFLGDNDGRRFMIYDAPSGSMRHAQPIDRDAITNKQIVIEPKPLSESVADIQRFIENVVAHGKAYDSSGVLLVAPTGRAAAALAAYFAAATEPRRYHFPKLEVKPLSGSSASFAIIDEAAFGDQHSELAQAFDGLWPMPCWPDGSYADRIIELKNEYAKMDDWRRLYECRFPSPEDMTEKERKAAHRETYLRHNKVRSKKGGARIGERSRTYAYRGQF